MCSSLNCVYTLNSILLWLLITSTSLIGQCDYFETEPRLKGYSKTRTSFYLIRESGRLDTFHLTTKEYNKHGYIVRQIVSDTSGIKSLTTFEYVKDTLLRKSSVYSGRNGKLKSSKLMIYDSKMNRRKFVETDSAGHEIMSEEYQFDKRGRLCKINRIIHGEQFPSIKLRYNKKGELKGSNCGHDWKKEIVTINENEYDEVYTTGPRFFKQIKRIIRKRVDGSVIKDTEYQGNLGSMDIVENTLVFGPFKSHYIEMIYKPNGLLEKISYFIDEELKYSSSIEYIP